MNNSTDGGQVWEPAQMDWFEWIVVGVVAFVALSIGAAYVSMI